MGFIDALNDAGDAFLNFMAVAALVVGGGGFSVGLITGLLIGRSRPQLAKP